MIVKRCDRCKKDLYPAAEFTRISITRSYDGVSYERELCPSCGKTLEKTLLEYEDSR
jgi:hypothetical protein